MTWSKSKRISRRDFVRVSAATGATVVGASCATTTAPKQGERPTKLLKVGLLGCGGRGTGALFDCLTGNPNVVVTALADLFEDKVQVAYSKVTSAMPERHDLDESRCYAGLDAYARLLETDIDILIEGTLPYSRPKHIAAAVEAGKHLFSEKPFASDPVGVRTIIEASKKHEAAGLSFVAGTQRRHQKEYIETIEQIHAGAIGDVTAMRVYWCGGLPFARDRQPDMTDFEYRIRNWYNYCWASADNIVEQHIHNLDVANWVLGGPPAEVFASGGRTWKPLEEKYGDLYDHFSCDYTYPNGVHVFSFCRHWDGRDGGVFEEAYGTKGVSNCHDMGEPGTKAYVQEHMDLVDSICGTGPYLNEGVRCAESTLTAIMGRMSAYTGKRITWDEAMNSDLSIVPEVWSFDREYPVGPVPNPVLG